MGVRVLLAVLVASAPALAAPGKAAKLPPSPPQPESPKIAVGPRTFVAFAGQPAPVKLAWSTVPGAAKYHTRWTTGTTVVEGEVTLPAFEQPELAPGQHVLTVTAVDAGGLASAPVDVAVAVVTVEAVAPGGQPPNAPPSRAYALGATFSSPGLRCQLGAGEVAFEAVAKAPGAMTLRCGGEPGQPLVEVPIVIAPVLIGGDIAPVARDTPTRIHITVASSGAIGEHLEVAAIGDLDLGAAERVTGGLEVPITAGAAAASAGLIVRANHVELGRVALDLVDKPAPEVIPPPEVDWLAVDLGAHVGGFIPPDIGHDANNLGHPMDADDTLSSGPLFGVSLGLFPTRRVGFELESAIATSSYTGRLGVAALMINRGQIAARIVEDGRFGLRGLIGADVLTTLTSGGTSTVGSLGGLHYGAAFSVETRPGVSVRVEALHVITVAQDAGYAHCLELQIGVVTRLGRRDHWK